MCSIHISFLLSENIRCVVVRKSDPTECFLSLNRSNIRTFSIWKRDSRSWVLNTLRMYESPEVSSNRLSVSRAQAKSAARLNKYYHSWSPATAGRKKRQSSKGGHLPQFSGEAIYTYFEMKHWLPSSHPVGSPAQSREGCCLKHVHAVTRVCKTSRGKAARPSNGWSPVIESTPSSSFFRRGKLGQFHQF